MSDCPDSLLEAKARQQTTKHQLEDAALHFNGGIGSLIQKAAHESVAFRGSIAPGNPGTLLFARADPDPRGQVLLGRKCCCRSANFGDNLVAVGTTLTSGPPHGSALAGLLGLPQALRLKYS